ncbi:MAG: hypothetical protein ACK53Y_23005, partial [bacterium]
MPPCCPLCRSRWLPRCLGWGGARPARRASPGCSLWRVPRSPGPRLPSAGPRAPSGPTPPLVLDHPRWL